jgi:hypothetical protein
MATLEDFKDNQRIHSWVRAYCESFQRTILGARPCA